MSFMKRPVKTIYRNEFNKFLEDNGCKTAEHVVDALFNEDWADYLVIKRYTKGYKSTLINRLNCLWVYPVFICTIPLQFIVLGKYGVDENSKIGHIITYLCGGLK